MGSRRVGALAVLVFAACCLQSAQAQCGTTFSKALAAQPGMTIVAQAIGALTSSADGGLFPTAADGVTLLAPTDTAFLSALAASGLSAQTATATLGDKVVSVLLYHVLTQGAFNPRQLANAGSVQTALGNLLKEQLPLSFGPGTGTSNGTVVSGVAGTATLGKQMLVCSSNVYTINSLLLPAATITAVPSVLGADASAASPAGAVSASGPAFAMPGPDGAPGPTAGVLAPASAPISDLAPAPGPAATPATALAPGPTISAPTTSAGLTPSLISGLGIAPDAGGGAGAFAALSTAAVLACSAMFMVFAL